MTKSIELLPCPFCGGKPIKNYYSIECNNCPISFSANIDEHNNEKRLEYIHISWNRRIKPELI